MTRDVPETEPGDERAAFTFHQLADFGVLWLINRAIFHPRGYALALDYAEGETEPRGWSIIATDGMEPYTFSLPAGLEDTRFRDVERLLSSARTYGRVPELPGDRA